MRSIGSSRSKRYSRYTEHRWNRGLRSHPSKWQVQPMHGINGSRRMNWCEIGMGFLKASLRFGSTLYEDSKAVLMDLKQTETVSKYQAQFEELSMKVNDLAEHWLISFYIARLEDDLRCELLLAQPTTYYQVISMAKLHEKKSLSTPHNSKSSTTKLFSPSILKVSSSSTPILGSTIFTLPSTYKSTATQEKGNSNEYVNIVISSSISNPSSTRPYKRFSTI